MKAIVYEKFGPPEVLKLKEVEKPTPKKNEVLIRVHATTVGYGDLFVRAGMNLKTFNMPIFLYPMVRLIHGIRKPKKKILGGEISGVVEEIGKNVTKFKKGDQVFVYDGQNFGGTAEYKCMSEKGNIAIKPTNQSFEEAAGVPYGAIMAYSLIERSNIQKGQKVLILGASGGIGHYAVQFAKYYGAEVTGICSTARVDLVKTLGADKVIDYTKEDFTKNGETYDVIFDVLHRTSFKKVKKSLTKKGRYILASFGVKNLLHMYWRKLRGGKKVICMLARESGENLTSIKELIEEGKIISVVDKTFPLEQAVEAHVYIQDGHKKGHVVITLDHL